MKGHTTRMYLDIQNNGEKEENKKRKAAEDVTDVVERMLTEVRGCS